MKCDTCEWFDTNFTYILVGGHGWCRRYPPDKDEFPRVYKHSWCGEYKKASPEQIQRRPAIKELTDEKTRELTEIVMSASNNKKPHVWYDEILHKVGIRR